MGMLVTLPVQSCGQEWKKPLPFEIAAASQLSTFVIAIAT